MKVEAECERNQKGEKMEEHETKNIEDVARLLGQARRVVRSVHVNKVCIATGKVQCGSEGGMSRTTFERQDLNRH